MFTVTFRRRVRRAAPSCIAATLLLGVPGCTPGADVPARLDAAEARVTAAYADGTLHGATVLIAGDSAQRASTRTIASGVASLPDGPAIDSSSRFRLASLTKLFTQLAILRLVDDGHLDLDATLASVRPGFDAAWAETVTIRQLLTFRSGLPRERSGAMNPIDAGVTYDADGGALADLNTWTADGPSVAPGARTQYSNLGYFHLGAVIEAVHGAPYEAALRELVLDRVGVTDTALHGGDDLDGRAHVHGHQRDADGALTAVPAFPVSVRYSAGGMYGTVADLAAVTRALLDGTLLSDASRALLFSNFGEDDDGRIRAAGHVPGFGNAWIIIAQPPCAVITLNNAVDASPRGIIDAADAIAAALASVAPPASSTDLAPAKEGWTRIASIDALPQSPLRPTIAEYIASLLRAERDAHFAVSLACRGLEEPKLSEDERAQFTWLAGYETTLATQYGPFTVAAWRDGEEANTIEILLEHAAAGRALRLRIGPASDDPALIGTLGVATIGFRPDESHFKDAGLTKDE